jgi:hypothetical protein
MQSRQTFWRRLGRSTAFTAVRAERLDAAREQAVRVLLDRKRSGPGWIQAEMATARPQSADLAVVR